MAIIYNTNHTHNPNAYLTLAIQRAAEELFGKENIVVADNMSLASAAASGQHDTLLCIDGQRINQALIRRVRPAFKTVILWTFEDPFMQEINGQLAPLFDHVFTNDPASVSVYQGKGHYLPLAASPSLHERPVRAAADCEYDLFFAGTMWPNRVRTLRRVLASFPDVRLKLVCPGNEYLPPLPDDIAALALQRPVSHEAFIDFANASAVTLTMFRDYASHGDVSQATAPGPRYFELGLAGTAQVVEVARGMDVEHFRSVDGVHLAHDDDEVVESIARLLRDHELRQDSALAAQKSVIGQHLYAHRLQFIREVTQAEFTCYAPANVVPTPRRNRLRVLMCTHSTIHEQVWGGVEVYQRELCSFLGRDVEFFFWLRRGTNCRLLSANGHELERFDIAECSWDDVVCDAQEEMLFSSVLSQYNIDVVHFQHLGHHALSLPLIAKASGTGVLFSAHDFWLVSSRYNLLNQEMRHVEDQFGSVLAMDIMLKQAEGIEYGGEQTRRAFIDRMLHHVDAIMFGTAHSRDFMHRIYPVLDRKISLVNGIPSPDVTVPVVPNAYRPLEERPLGVAVVGNFARTKGADTILSLIEAAHPDHFHFHILGYVHPDYQPVLEGMKRPNVTVHGRYEVGNTDVMKQADVALFLSIWPETYCISLSEAWQYGLVPIVTEIGALDDRVTDGVNGFKVPVSRADVVLERLELLRSSEDIRRKMMEAITPDLWTHEGDYTAGLLSLYRELAPKRLLGVSDLMLDAGQLGLLPISSWKNQAPPRHIFDPPLVRDLAINLPSHINDWFAIQGANCYLDDICHHVLVEGAEKTFKSADEFHLRGWLFIPGVTTAGQLHVVLISEDERSPLIFLKSERESRGDISELFGADVPRRSGFSVKAALRGKWCEGWYRIGLVNSINGRGAFQLLAYGLEVEGSKVKSIRAFRLDNDVILNDFYRVVNDDNVLRGVPLTRFPRGRLFAQEQGTQFYFMDRLELLAANEDTTLVVPPEELGGVVLRGWSFMAGQGRSGTVYAAMVSEETDEIVLFAMSRFARDDVRTAHHDAPLCSGFEGLLRPWKGRVSPMGGVWHLALVNIIGEIFGTVVTDICMQMEGGRCQVLYREMPTDEQQERIRQLVLDLSDRQSRQ
ncbi:MULTISPECIES: glycosyltransferase [Acetobacteraceae]|uniref:glycosyltransferase family protein n=1 Tax=Acetobacteraceae TaxID=433 RepID=UPI0020556C34|nr:MULTISPECIES: glycosyltransferase [Acetobacteraceae]MCT6846130.1 glycosyltransferase [Bombella apis]UPO79487.1 glycosyltransferase [Parasaccharibacter sp. TMW 2.1888]